MKVGRDAWVREGVKLSREGTVEQALSYLAAQYERLVLEQQLTIASLKELVADLKELSQDWSRFAAGIVKERGEAMDKIEALEQERNNLLQVNPVLRGELERQRETIEEQADKIESLRDQVC
jgi:chromosome segregation ATPase